MARPIRVYADTSVFGGAFDEAFAEATERFFALVEAGALSLVASPIVLEELERAPALVQALRDRVLPIVHVTSAPIETYQLRTAYLAAGVVGEAHEADALHVASATVAGCALIVSWNFRHIVNFRRIPLYNAVNVLNGYSPIAIHSPLEVIGDDPEEGL